MIPLIQFDGKTNTPEEWETRREWEYWEGGREDKTEETEGYTGGLLRGGGGGGGGWEGVRTNGRVGERKAAGEWR